LNGILLFLEKEIFKFMEPKATANFRNWRNGPSLAAAAEAYCADKGQPWQHQYRAEKAGYDGYIR